MEIEEEYFRKNYPDNCYGDKPLSPYWDFFQDGVEFGERQFEKKIEELEQENAVLKGRTEGFEKQILGLLYKYESVYKRFPDLKDAMNEAERVLKENTELEQQIEKMKCCANCSKYDRYNRVCSRTKFSIIETLCNCSDDWELRR